MVTCAGVFVDQTVNGYDFTADPRKPIDPARQAGPTILLGRQELLHLLAKAVAHTADCFDAVSVAAKFLSERADVNIDGPLEN
jgi:hypothetical protein